MRFCLDGDISLCMHCVRSFFWWVYGVCYGELLQMNDGEMEGSWRKEDQSPFFFISSTSLEWEVFIIGLCDFGFPLFSIQNEWKSYLWIEAPLVYFWLFPPYQLVNGVTIYSMSLGFLYFYYTNNAHLVLFNIKKWLKQIKQKSYYLK